jgi:hypothetical protein
MAHPEERLRRTSAAKVLRKYYSKFIESHRMTLKENTIEIKLSFLPEIPVSLREDIRGRITDELRREMPGTKITVKIKQENYSNNQEVVYV